jgi:NAD(P)-dependent dehydrogenase (short-subunit alcohol dehydrogenase family)
VADRTQVIAAVQQTVSRFGGLDILVTAAQGFGTAAAPASSPVPQPVEDFDEQQWSYTLLTGPTTTLWAMQAAFPHLRASGHGRVITFGSGQALVGAEGGAAYNAAKEAVRALSRTAAREWGKYGITVNVVSPLITTDTTRDYFSRRPGLEDNVLADLPLRGMGEPTDVGALAVFLAGDGAKFITGMTIKIDSGKHMFA